MPGDIFKVETILAKRTRGNQVEYYIKWLNYDDSENTWEPAHNILDPQLIINFEKRVNARKQSTTKAKAAPAVPTPPAATSTKTTTTNVVETDSEEEEANDDLAADGGEYVTSSEEEDEEDDDIDFDEEDEEPIQIKKKPAKTTTSPKKKTTVKIILKKPVDVYDEEKPIKRKRGRPPKPGKKANPWPEKDIKELSEKISPKKKQKVAHPTTTTPQETTNTPVHPTTTPQEATNAAPATSAQPDGTQSSSTVPIPNDLPPDAIFVPAGTELDIPSRASKSREPRRLSVKDVQLKKYIFPATKVITEPGATTITRASLTNSKIPKKPKTVPPPKPAPTSIDEPIGGSNLLAEEWDIQPAQSSAPVPEKPQSAQQKTAPADDGWDVGLADDNQQPQTTKPETSVQQPAQDGWDIGLADGHKPEVQKAEKRPAVKIAAPAADDGWDIGLADEQPNVDKNILPATPAASVQTKPADDGWDIGLADEYQAEAQPQKESVVPEPLKAVTAHSEAQSYQAAVPIDNARQSSTSKPYSSTPSIPTSAAHYKPTYPKPILKNYQRHNSHARPVVSQQPAQDDGWDIGLADEYKPEVQKTEKRPSVNFATPAADDGWDIGLADEHKPEVQKAEKKPAVNFATPAADDGWDIGLADEQPNVDKNISSSTPAASVQTKPADDGWDIGLADEYKTEEQLKAEAAYQPSTAQSEPVSMYDNSSTTREVDFSDNRRNFHSRNSFSSYRDTRSSDYSSPSFSKSPRFSRSFNDSTDSSNSFASKPFKSYGGRRDNNRYDNKRRFENNSYHSPNNKFPRRSENNSSRTYSSFDDNSFNSSHSQHSPPRHSPPQVQSTPPPSQPPVTTSQPSSQLPLLQALVSPTTPLTPNFSMEQLIQQISAAILAEKVLWSGPLYTSPKPSHRTDSTPKSSTGSTETLPPSSGNAEQSQPMEQTTESTAESTAPAPATTTTTSEAATSSSTPTRRHREAPPINITIKSKQEAVTGLDKLSKLRASVHFPSIDMMKYLASRDKICDVTIEPIAPNQMKDFREFHKVILSKNRVYLAEISPSPKTTLAIFAKPDEPTKLCGSVLVKKATGASNKP